MIVGLRKQKNAQAEQYIKKHVMLLAPGEALPPLRLLIQESGIGRNVLNTAIQKMVERRLLESRERSGIYRTEFLDNSESVKIIDIVACSEIRYLATPGTFFPDLVEKLSAEATRRGYSMRVHRVNFHDRVQAYEELIRAQSIQNAILISPHTDEIVKIFDDNRVNWVGIMPRYTPSRGPMIVDAPDMVDIQMKHLIALGHRRIAFVDETDPESPAITHIMRRESYYRLMAEHGFRVYPEWLIPSTANEKNLFDELQRMMDGTEAPTAIITCDFILASVYRFAALRGLRIGRDISIIAFDGLENSNLHPAPTSVINSREQIAGKAWNMFEKVLTMERYDALESIELQLKIGQSTGPVGKVMK